MIKKGIVFISLWLLILSVGAGLGGFYHKKVVEAENINRIQEIYQSEEHLEPYDKYKFHQDMEVYKERREAKFFVDGYISLMEDNLDIAKQYFEKSRQEINLFTPSFVRYYNNKFLADIMIKEGQYIKAKEYIDQIFNDLDILKYNYDYRMVWDLLKTVRRIPEGNTYLIQYLEKMLKGRYLTAEAQSYYLRKIIPLYILENNDLVATNYILELLEVSNYPDEEYYKGKGLVDLSIINKNLGAYEWAIQILESIDVEIENPIKAADLEIYKLINLAQNKTIIQDYQGALADIEKVSLYIDQLPNCKREELKVSLLIKQAQIAIGQGEVEKAKELLKQTNIEEWENIKIYVTIQREYIEVVAAIYMAEERYEEAIKIYEGILGQLCEEMNIGNYERVLKSLEEIFKKEEDTEAVQQIQDVMRVVETYWRNLNAKRQYDYVVNNKAFRHVNKINQKNKIKSYLYMSIISLLILFMIHIKLLPWLKMKYLRHKISYFMSNNKYFLVYQPIINPKTEQIIGIESLLRLSNKGEIIYPNVFIPEIQRAQMMDEIALWEIREISKIYEQFKDLEEIDPSFYISINLSLKEIIDPIFIEKIKQEAKELMSNKARICIEITENVGMLDEVLVKKHIAELIEYGFKVAIDDFGVEYANISMLDHFEFHTLKLDKHFIDNIHESVVVQYLMKVINELANELEISIVVEGVEEEWQKDYLTTFSSEMFYIQGYYYSKPLTLEQLKVYRINKGV